jgi:hypothetical protein
VKRPPQDPDEEVKEPATPPCADAPIWPPAEDAEVALFIIPGKPMPWASVIDTRSASRLTIAGFDPPLFRTPAPPLPSLATEAASTEDTRLPAVDETVTELFLNAETPALEAPAVFDFQLSADADGDVFDQPLLDAPPSTADERHVPPRWWANAPGTAAAAISRLWSTARYRIAAWQAAARQQSSASSARVRTWMAAGRGQAARQLVAMSMTSRDAAWRVWSKASRRVALLCRAMYSWQRGAVAGVSQRVAAARSHIMGQWPVAIARQHRALNAGLSRAVIAMKDRVVAEWPRAVTARRHALTAGLSRVLLAGRERLSAARPRVRAGREHIGALGARIVAVWPRFVALTAAGRAGAIRAWVHTRGRLAMLPAAVARLALQQRQTRRIAAITAASFVLAFSAVLLVWPLAQWMRSTHVDGPLAAKSLTAVAALAPAIGQNVTAIVLEGRREVTRPSLARVQPSQPPATLVPRRVDARAIAMSSSPPVVRDAVPADLPAPVDRSRDSLVPAPFPTPREGAARASRTDEARIESIPPLAERSSNRPVPAPFPTPRRDRSDRVAVPGDLAARDGIAEALRQLELAYQRRDAKLAKAVWPTVNERALARAFDGLRSQSVKFDDCQLDVSGAAGEVECRGVTTYVTRVGSQDRRKESRQWKFRVQKDADSWLIMSAAAR